MPRLTFATVITRLLALGACAVVPSTLAGQTLQPLSLQGSLLYVIPGGDAFVGTKSGAGFELQLRRTFSAWSLGGGVQYSRHDIGASDPLALVGLFLEPRYTLPVSLTNLGPYLSGRAAVFQQRFSSDGVTGKATGGQLNAGGGVIVRLSQSVNADIGVTFGYLKFGEYKAQFTGGAESTVASASGTNAVLRGGFTFGFGK